MIEPTDEMIEAYQEASWDKPVGSHGAEFPNVRDGLAAVLAIVERDYDVLQHDAHPGSPCWKRDWVGEPYLRCEVQATP
jgi:hypothetical protein